MSQHLSEAGRVLTRFARRLRSRVWLWAVCGAMSLGVGATATCLGFGSWWIGAAPAAWLTAAWWTVTLVAAVLASRVALRPLPSLRGAGVARVLASEDPQLAHDARSALELVQRPEGSGELVEALASSVQGRLQALSPTRLTRPRMKQLQIWLLTLLTGGAMVAIALATEHGQAGLFALTHPDWLGSERREGVWVGALSMDVTPPLHVEAIARRYLNPAEVQVHAGSRVEVRISPRMKLARAALVIGELELPLHRDERGDWTGAWVAEAQGPVELRGWTEGWLNDARPRYLKVIPDAAPEVQLNSPSEDMRVAASQRVALSYEASDDHGLAGIDLVVRGPGAQEHRQRVLAPPSGERHRTLGGETVLRAADFQVRPGDTLSLWLEASDLNRHVGPLVGHSAIRTLTVAGEGTGQSAPVVGLTEAREQALALLADRLEREVPEGVRAARRRYNHLASRTRKWLATLHELAPNLEKDTAALVRGMGRRVRRALGEEGDLHRTPFRPFGRRKQADERAIGGLEGDVLWLADLLARARVKDAEAVLSQIHSAEERMRSLLEQLADADSETSKRALLAEVARMRAQMHELMAKLRDVRGTVPAEFVNREAMQTSPPQDALSELEQAIESGKVEDAESALDALSQQLKQLEKGLGETGVALSSARFAPRNQATDKTLQQLEQLEQTQRALSEQANQVGRQAAARSGAAAGAEATAGRLSQRAERLADQLEQLGGDRVSGPMGEARSTAAQRLRDVGDSLRAGDYFEGQSMAKHAAGEMRGLSRELEMDARMFPGSGGELFDVARKAEELRQQAEKLAEEVGEAAPDLDKLLEERDRQRVREQAVPQQELAGDTRQARKRLQQSRSDDGLSAGAADGLNDVEQAMRRAGEALKRGELQDAQAHQREAMERMAQLRQDLSRQARASAPGDSSSEDGRGRSNEDDERVAIPENADEERRGALRRRVLDARRGAIPEGYEHTIEKFYEELLR